MIKEYTTTEQIETSLKVISSKHLNNMWANVKDTMEKSSWVSAFNYRLEKFFSGEEIGH